MLQWKSLQLFKYGHNNACVVTPAYGICYLLMNKTNISHPRLTGNTEIKLFKEINSVSTKCSSVLVSPPKLYKSQN